jgi:DNA-binding NarL/FixJ family response regulator
MKPDSRRLSLETSSFRILLADSFEPWLHYVRSTLEKCEGLQIVGEARDGLAAVQKAIELKPDLVLLSLGLPKLSGIEAAKQISKAIPGVKCLFATQIIDQDMMAEALNNGTHGYIWKMDAQRDLLPAIKTIRQGQKFIGGGTKG